MSKQSSVPLCVDLDGSLVKQDLLLTAFIDLLKKNFFANVLLLLVWPLQGRAAFKARVAAKATIDFTAISFNQELIKFLINEQAEGRKIILVTANDKKIASTVANYLGFFSEVIASEGIVNLKGTNKANELVKRYGSEGFDYVGDSDYDVPVWKEARKVYVVARIPKLLAKVNKQKKIERVFNW